jgi:hypothetical protein
LLADPFAFKQLFELLKEASLPDISNLNQIHQALELITWLFNAELDTLFIV